MTALTAADLPAVFECLISALSHDAATQKQAEAALRELEARPGFCSCLAVSIYCLALDYRRPASTAKLATLVKAIVAAAAPLLRRPLPILFKCLLLGLVAGDPGQ